MAFVSVVVVFLACKVGQNLLEEQPCFLARLRLKDPPRGGGGGGVPYPLSRGQVWRKFGPGAQLSVARGTASKTPSCLLIGCWGAVGLMVEAKVGLPKGPPTADSLSVP